MNNNDAVLTSSAIHADIAAELAAAPLIDMHTHLRWSQPQAHSLAEIVFYHFVSAELLAAGMPRAALELRDPDARLRAALPYLPLIRCGATHYCLRRILQDLYGMREECLTEDNLDALSAQVAASAQNHEWPRYVLRECARIRHSLVDISFGRGPHPGASTTDVVEHHYEDILIPIVENGALIGANMRMLLDSLQEDAGIEIVDAATLVTAVERYFQREDLAQLQAFQAWGAEDLRYQDDDPDRVTAAIVKARGGARLAHAERNAIAIWSLRAILRVLQPRHIPFMLFLGSTGARFGPPACTYDAATLPSLARLIYDYPDTQFVLLLGNMGYSQQAAIMAKMHPNLHLAGVWWHCMYPTFIRRMIEERLDVCPLNKVSAFFSDAYMAEWSYGKWQLVQRELAHALAARVASGYLTRNDASAVIRMWTWDNPVRLLRLDAAQR